MRITGGIHRSRKLETPKGAAVRPTSDKVRQAVFNMLKSRDVLADAVVVDAFCGTGALGLEALSQGAAHCIFFDSNKNSVQLCKINVEALKETERSHILFQDSTKLKMRSGDMPKADLVFLDPPYNKNLIPLAVQSLHDGDWLSDDAFFVMEVDKNEKVTSDIIHITDEKIYGDTKILLGFLKS
jgi:16S rRNA (guanine966-N2)-methyltransferase